tara:strand:- start:478 stop:672 length:195 start_codon:yes stop_codon:yes gene_type:complete
MMKAGDLIKTICFGPSGKVGEVGIIVEQYVNPRFLLAGKCWLVSFRDTVMVVAQDGLEILNESR